MKVSESLPTLAQQLVERYGSLGKSAAQRFAEWASGRLPFTYPSILEQHLEQEQVDLIFDAFWQILPFGTGGRRGRVGYGSNRVNPTTIAITVQGHCEYLKRVYPGREQLAVVVANDVRVFNDLIGTYAFLRDGHPLLGLSSRSLARLAAEVYAANGIIAYVSKPHSSDAILSTPELSFLIPRLKAVGGINISASHNPPDDNGIKVYDQFGSQPIAPDDQNLVEAMERVTSVQTMAFEEALAQQLIRAIPDDLHAEYIQLYTRLYFGASPGSQEPLIVYTPLCGCGLSTVGDVLTALGLRFAVPPDQLPDGRFAVIPFRAPNPEVPEATDPAKRFADEIGAGIVLSSDPDADRVGLEAKLQDGSWHHFDGNQIATILCYLLMLDPEGPQRRGLVIETLVTTRILRAIIEKAGDSVLIDDLLVGFKYVADVLKILESRGDYRGIRCSPQDLVLATEESHGVIVYPYIRDKDATPACMYLAQLYQRLRKAGRTLFDYYVDILEELGPYGDTSRSIMMAGADGIFKRDQIMQSLRDLPPKEIAGLPIRKIVDHWDQTLFGPFKSETDKLPRNVIQLFCENFILAVRPSGTEPKLKLYCQILPDQGLLNEHGVMRVQAAANKAERLAVAAYGLLLERIGVRLSVAALLLPDIVDLGRKQEFDANVLPQFKEAISSKKLTTLEECKSWLRARVAQMTPGADPLPAIKRPLVFALSTWKEALGDYKVTAELERWAHE